MPSRVVVIFAAAFLFAGCATPPKDDPEALAEFEKANDPIEPFNRVVFDFNMFVDKLIFKPIATMYDGAMPEYGQPPTISFLNWVIPDRHGREA